MNKMRWKLYIEPNMIKEVDSFIQHIQLVLNLARHDIQLLKHTHVCMVRTHWRMGVEYSTASEKGFEEGRSGNTKK